MKFRSVLPTLLHVLNIISLINAADRPNFLFILTDDQDNHMNSLDYMPEVQEHLISKGTSFSKHFCTIAICCPSRVELWTGQMSHNTNVTNVQPPWGGYPKFIQGGYNDHHLALWMQQSGYNTYYSGKLFNGHGITTFDQPLVSGYTGSAFFLEPFTYQYFNVSVTRNGGPPENPIGVYSTDYLAQTAQEFLDEAIEDKEKPFFITLAPVAPHGFLTEYPVSRSGPPEVAERHRELFQDYKIPRGENFNPDSPSSVNWISTLEKLNDTVIEYNDEYQRLRLRALRAVDEMVGDVIRRLEEEGVLDNTFVIYSSDNGFHISQHRLHPGKMCGLETDINVPMIIRGPGVPQGVVKSDAPSTHGDLAPTIMRLAGNNIDDKQFDGTPMDLGLPDDSPSQRTEHVAVEFWGIGLGESKYASDAGPLEYENNTYKGLRIEAKDYAFYYSVWCNNVREIYDMKNDHAQLHNLLAEDFNDNAFELSSRSLDIVVNRLDALMMVLKSCKETSCVDPWGALHPDGGVKSLADALSSDYDAFYEAQVKVEFQRCVRGYILDAEGPQEFNIFDPDNNQGLGGEFKRLSINADWSLAI